MSDLVEISPEVIDDLGRVLPAKTVDLRTAHYWTARSVLEMLSVADAYRRVDAYDRIVRAARAVGIDRGPADLAGRRSLFREWWQP